MKKPSTFLFWLRLFFYLSVALLVQLHPGVSVSFDKTGLIQWFVIIPVEALIAFHNEKLKNKIIIALVSLCIFSVWVGGFSTAALPPFFAGAVAFTLTLLLFHYPRWGKLSALEPFFLAWVCFRLLVFSRSGEDAAESSLRFTQFLLVWTAVVFLLHSALVYFCLYSNSRSGVKKEASVLALCAVAILALVIFILPADYVRNAVISNLRPDRIDKSSKISDNDYGIPEDSGGRRNGRGTIPGDQNGRRPGLRTLSEYDWPGPGGRRGGRGGSGEAQQYTVMVVASKKDPVYMGDSFRGRLDPVEGFLTGPEVTLNRLPSQRLFVTWFDNEFVRDRGRQMNEVFSLSTLPQKFLPYRPYAVEPTVLSEMTGPFRYVHSLVSNMHTNDDPLSLLRVSVRDLNSLETASLEPYLEITLNNADREVFSRHIDRVMESWQDNRYMYMGNTGNEYMEKIAAILMGFSDYQYDANNGEEHTVSALVNFLSNTKEGNCVEFSNTAALLGRFAGIPSRVVTGYLASDGLQTVAHLRGLMALRNSIPLLEEFPFDDLYLVTDAHAHSWTQFYVPDYGWLDFEATQFAIPPIGSGDANLRDVVIPRLDGGNQVFAPVRAFPWRLVLKVLAWLAASALIGAYIVRYAREAALYFFAQRGGRQGARSLYLLLLAKLAADGKPIKPASKTATEYSKLFPKTDENGPFARFAALYTELRWRKFSNKSEEEGRFMLLKDEYQKIIAATRRKGFRAFVIRLFSLRGLAYL